MFPIKTCGGGNSFGSDKPSAQQTSHNPANRPIDTAPHSRRCPVCAIAAQGSSPNAEPPNGRSAASGSGFVFELAIQVLVLGDHLLEQRPVDRIPARLLLDVTHLDDRLDAIEDELRLVARPPPTAALTLRCAHFPSRCCSTDRPGSSASRRAASRPCTAPSSCP